MLQLSLRRIPVMLAVVVASSLAVNAFAQGRHDEKPHGMKQVEERELVEPKVHPGGRHPEQSHKAAIKAQQERRAAAAKKAAPPNPAKPAEPAAK
jgi:hypothetical protein